MIKKRKIKTHPGEKCCPAKKAISRPQGDVKTASVIVGDVFHRSRAARVGTHAENEAKDGSLGPAGAAERGKWGSMSKFALWQGSA